tara:strand:+ start:48 stop:377 length:330 start_codon:yes stop_codon:yes gene_type:complete
MKHILFDLHDCPSDLLDSETHIRVCLWKAGKVCNSEVLDVGSYRFQPQGITGYAMLADSHISIHTWPEKGIAKCDIFTCGDKSLPELAVQFLSERLLAKKVTSNSFDRL